MLLNTLSILAVCIPAWGLRDTGRGFKTIPSISNSLVNLGKMDITFHFDSKTPLDTKSESISYHSKPSLVSKIDSVIDDAPCLCSAFKNMKNSFLNNPSDIIHKILRSNDVFNQDSMSSPMCCESHEHVQEDTVFFEFGPKHHSSVDHLALPNSPSEPVMPLIWDSIIPNKNPLSSVPMKPKAIEIYFFPKNKDLKELNTLDFTKMRDEQKSKDLIKKQEIQVVGDKELKNEFKNFKFRPSIQIPVMRQAEDRRTNEVTSSQVNKKDPFTADEMTYVFPKEKTQDEKREEEKEEKRLEDMKTETPTGDTATVSTVSIGGEESTSLKPLNTL